MSRHHVEAKHNSMTRTMRPILQAQLPLPCIEPHCRRGGVVYPDDIWDVAHLVDLALGGDPNQVSVAHRSCNRSSGGRAGRAKQLNRNQTSKTDETRGFPKWT